MSYKWDPYQSMDDFRKTVVQFAQATRFESQKLWEARHEHCEWISIPEGRMYEVCRLGDKPVWISVQFAVIDNKRTLFWEMTGTAQEKELAANWVKAGCHPDAQEFTMFPELKSIPMQVDEAGAVRELQNVVYFIDAHDGEAQLVEDESRCDADIKLDPMAYGVNIGEVDGKPLVLKLLFATVNTRRIVFWMPGSIAFDFTIAEKWLETHGTLLATTKSVVRADATNFYNCVHEINRMNERQAQAA